ncbi:MAG: UbiA family prenyltransferase [Microbacteriaceae bacterium]
MTRTRPGTVLALALSTHPGPGLGVTVVTAVLGIGVGLEPWRVAVLALAMLSGQCSVGLSNDWIDAQRDIAVGRTDKPIARGWVSASSVRSAAFVTAALAMALTVPLGLVALAVHTLFIASAWSYNLGLKKTALSVLPYIVSFGSLPLLATTALSPPTGAAWWALAAGALLGVSAHVANVLPDLADDAATGVRGMPHRLGMRACGLLIAGSLAAASALIVFGAGVAPSVLEWVALAATVILAALCAWLAITRPPTRVLFQLIIAAAIIDVVMLALSGSRVIA